MNRNTPHTSIIKLWIKSNWYDSICSIQTYVLTKTCKQDKNVPSRSLFQEQRAPSHASNSNSRDQAHERTPNLNTINHSTDIPKIEMAEARSNKRQSLGETSGKIKRRSITNGSHHNTQRYQMELWYGFMIMEELAYNAGHTTQAQKSAQANIDFGIPPAEALELATASIAFLRVAQRAWPYTRLDNTPDQQFHLMQIPFDIQVDADTGLALMYQILVHFEKPTKEYVSAEITQLTATRLTLMGIQTGDILEAIVPLCNTKPSQPWTGMIKLYLKLSTTDGQ
jgi:hypothetical protein